MGANDGQAAITRWAAAGCATAALAGQARCIPCRQQRPAPLPCPSQYQNEDPAWAALRIIRRLPLGGEMPHNVHEAATRSGKLTGRSAVEKQASSGRMSFLGGLNGAAPG
jgi:hypothetical protein